MNIVDIAILSIFFLSILMGLARGLISEIVSLATLLAAFVVAITFSSRLAAAFTASSSVQQVVSQTTNAVGVSTAQPISYVALGLSFAVLFGLTILAGAIVKMILNLAVATGMLGIGNRLLGGAFGAIRGFLINLVIIFLVQLSPFSTESWWQQSQLVPKFQPAVQWLASVVSPTLANLKMELGNTLQDVNTTFQGFTR